MLTIGQKAPEFTLFNSEKKEVSLSDFKGKKVVLLFFPQAFTSTCTAELCHMRDNYKVYENLNAEVMAISVDSVFTLDKYKTEQNLNFNVLSDFNKNVSLTYNTLHDTFAFGMKGVSKRSAFVLNEDGILVHYEILDNPSELPNFEAIEKALA